MRPDHLDRQLWAVAGSYRRRRRALVVLAPMVAALPGLVLLVQALLAGGDGLAVRLLTANLCVWTGGAISWLLHSSWGQWTLDRLPLASSRSRLAHHALRLYAAMRGRAPEDMWDTLPAAAALAHAARRLIPTGAQSTIPQIAGTALVATAQTATGDALAEIDEWIRRISNATDPATGPDQHVAEGPAHSDQHSYGPAERRAETMLALTRLAVLPAPRP